MRFERLDLLAFGNFTGTHLDFSPASRSFQVILGVNAAGKSTALRAITDLLFGVPPRTTDDFVHKMQHLRIGALISSSAGTTLEFRRRKGNKATILDPDENVIGDASLVEFLGLVDRQTFESMFGLGHERLREGAEDLLRARGALGETLFEAAGGTRSVRGVLNELAEATDGLFKPQASRPILNAAISSYTDARKQARSASLAGDQFRLLEDEIERVASEIVARREALSTLHVRKQKLARVQRNLPRLAKRSRLLADLETLGNVPDLPVNARDQRLELIRSKEHLERQIAEAKRIMGGLNGDLDRLRIPDELMREGERIKQLGDRLAVIRNAAVDLPKRRGELAAAREQVARTLNRLRLGLDPNAVEALAVPKPKAKHIQELARGHGRLQAQRESAVDALAAAERELDGARQRLRDAAVPRDVATLVDVVQRVRAEGNLEKEQQECTGKVKQLRKRLDVAAASLPGWHGDSDELETLPIPLAETVRRFDKRFRESDQQLARLGDKVREKKAEIEEVVDEIAGLVAAGKVPTLEQLVYVREHRERGWGLIRGRYIERNEDTTDASEYDAERPLPEAYEHSVTVADDVADRLRTDAERVTAHQALRRREKSLSAQLAQEVTALDVAGRLRETLETEWRTIWQPTAVEPSSAEEMIAWLDGHRRASEMAEHLHEAQGRCDKLGEQIRDCRQMLFRELDAVDAKPPDVQADLGLLLAHADRIVNEANAQKTSRTKLEQIVSERDERVRVATSDRDGAEQRMAAWVNDWRTAVGPFELLRESAPAEAEGTIELLSEVFNGMEAVSDLEHRVKRIEEDAKDFEAKVAELVAAITPDLNGEPADRALGLIAERLRMAERDAVSRDEKTAQHEALRPKLDTACRDLADVNDKLEAIVKRVGCSHLDQVDRVEQQATQKRDINKDVHNIEDQLVEDGGGAALDAVLAETEEGDGDTITAELADLDSQIEQVSEERDQELKGLGELQKKREEMLRVTDVAAMATQDAEDGIATIRSHAEEYMRLRLAETVLRDFIERYREKHQSPILKRASELFARLTLHTFDALRTDFDDEDHPVLVGIDPTGAALGVPAMSDGTRDQLYLALRLAAVEQYLQTAEPLPFVADDLLVHFDDDRARAALEVLAEFSRRTQVLFFTHHYHLVQLAREVVPADVLHVQGLA